MQFLIGFLLVVVTALGCGPRAGHILPATPDLTRIRAGAALGTGDVIAIRVYEEKELSGLYRVSTDGTFRFPLVGAVKAVGLSPGALGELITTKLRNGFIRDPQVTVLVKEFNSKKIFVLGKVRKPGTFRFDDEMSVVQAITLAGGLTALAEKNGIVLTRIVEGKEQKFVVPFEDIGLGKVPNIYLQPGDIVFVPESWL